MDKSKVISFVNEYTNLCQRYGLMIESWGRGTVLAIVPYSSRQLNENNREAIMNWERNNARTDVAPKKEEETPKELTD